MVPAPTHLVPPSSTSFSPGFSGRGYEQARDARLLRQAAIDHKPDALDALRDASNSVTSA
jgi:hypothetical protein